jgi:predicted transcriptional regulator
MEPRKKAGRPGPLETEIMNVLWEISPATAQILLRRLELELESRRLTPGKLARLRQTLKAKEELDGND